MRKVFLCPVLFALACDGAFGQSASTVQSAPPGANYNRPGSGLPVGPANPNAKITFTSPPIMPADGAQYRLSVVQWYMTFSSPLQIGDITLAGMGDEAAFDIYTLMANSGSPMTAAQTLTALDIIHKAFARPLAIQNGHTKPTNSLALLKMLQATAVDQVVKERIATETNFLNAVPEKIVPPSPAVHPPPPPGVPIGLF